MYLSPALHFVYFIYHLYRVPNYHASVCQQCVYMCPYIIWNYVQGLWTLNALVWKCLLALLEGYMWGTS